MCSSWTRKPDLFPPRWVQDDPERNFQSRQTTMRPTWTGSLSDARRTGRLVGI